MTSGCWLITRTPIRQFLAGRLDTRIREVLAGFNAQWKYPEHPGRLASIMELLAREPIPGVLFEAGAVASREHLSRVHTTNFLDAIDGLRGQNAWLDVDTTAVSPGSVEAAEVAAGTSIAAVEAVVQGRAKSAFALVRPPGHHAEPTRARGFCLLNNVAVAATHAQSVLGCQRVLIIDWDAHHGNGTQDIFWADPDVLYFDIHREAPYYPGSGRLDEIGAGLGEGTTVNVPVPIGSGDSGTKGWRIVCFRDLPGQSTVAEAQFDRGTDVSFRARVVQFDFEGTFGQDYRLPRDGIVDTCPACEVRSVWMRLDRLMLP